MSRDALIIVDAQNEFSSHGQRAVPNHRSALVAINQWLVHARANAWPVAWVQHHNRPHESAAFVPGTWGAELSPELEPRWESDHERLFQKDVFGAFTGTDLERWLRERGVSRVVVVGFYAHMCVSTTTREALVRGFDVTLDPEATGATAIRHEKLGEQSAFEVRYAAMLHLTHMGAMIESAPDAAVADSETPAAGARI